MSFESLPETDWRLLKVIGMDNTAYGLMKNTVVCFAWTEEGPFDVEIVDYH